MRLSIWELRHVGLPTFLPLCQDVTLPGLAESYYVIIPKPGPSLGDRSPGRASRSAGLSYELRNEM